MSISIGPAPILEDLVLWYDAANYKCYSGEPTKNQLSQDYYGNSGAATGDASVDLSGMFGLGLISQRPWSHEVWSLDNINKGKLLRYNAFFFDGINDYLSVPDDDKFSFTDGTDDLPFSIDVWAKMTDATNFIFVSKYGTSDAVREWLLYTDGTDKLNLFIRDTSGNTTTRTSSTAITAYEGQWVHITATFGGAGPNSASGFANAGDEINLYINGQIISMASAGNNASYTGMSNTSQDVWIGRQNVSYSNGFIKNVRIFNREVSATEVSNLYNYNTINGPSLVDFADQWAEANGGVYTSDFSAGVDSHSAAGGAVAGNIDSIGGENDTLRLTIDSSTGNHQILRSITSFTTVGKRYRFDADVYIPSTNTNVNGIEFNSDGSSGVNVINSTTTTDAWVRLSGELIGSYSEYRFRMKSSGSYVFTGNGTDVIYVKNVKITQIGILADFDLSNYNSDDKIVDKSSNAFVASPNGGVLARDRTIQYNLSFNKDKDNNDIATITRDPSSGAFFENTSSLTLFGEHPLYITNFPTGAKVSVSLQAKSNITGLFSGISFFNSGTSANERFPLNRVFLPDGYEWLYGTSSLIATGDNIGFELLVNKNFSSGWAYINLKKPQIELKDHATNFTPIVRTGDNTVLNLANRNKYAGTITNDVKSSGAAKLDGIESFYPVQNNYWEFNGVDSYINAPIGVKDYSKGFTTECVFSLNSLTNSFNGLFGISQPYYLAIRSNGNIIASVRLDGTQFFFEKAGGLSLNKNYYAALCIKNDIISMTGEVYLNNEFFMSSSKNGSPESFTNFDIGRNTSAGNLDGRIYMLRSYNRFLTSKEINHNFRAIKTKYNL